MSSRRKFSLALSIGSLLVLTWAVLPAPAAENAMGLLQTVPSRTPTPAPVPPSDTPPPPSPPPGGGNTPTPTATRASEPSVTPTELPEDELAPTPLGGYLPTAEPCGVPPTVFAQGVVNVRSGPGLDYEIIDRLVYLEVRPIVGRAAAAPWWQIERTGGDKGWVADRAVLVQGYTGSLPMIAPPQIDGKTPTPGTAWSPTPNPTCTPLPTPTPTSTVTATPTAGRSTEVNAGSREAAASTATSTMSPTETLSPSPTRQSATETPAIPSASPTAGLLVTIAPLPVDAAPSVGNWPLLAGLGLVIAAGIILFVRRRSG